MREALAPLENVEYVGSYWYLEGTNAKDHLVLSQVSACVHAAGLKFAWIPDYADGVEQGQAVQWRELGFDFATLQPNYAFYDVTTQRFANTSAAMSALGLGVEMELPMVVRNELIGANSTTSFYAYLDAAVQLGWPATRSEPTARQRWASSGLSKCRWVSRAAADHDPTKDKTTAATARPNCTRFSIQIPIQPGDCFKPI